MPLSHKWESRALWFIVCCYVLCLIGIAWLFLQPHPLPTCPDGMTLVRAGKRLFCIGYSNRG